MIHGKDNNFPIRSPTDIRREALKKRYIKLTREYEIVNKELCYLSGSEQWRKQLEAKKIFDDIEEVHGDLEALDDEKSLDPKRKYLKYEEKLQKIDFTEVKNVVEKVIPQNLPNRECGNAFFLLQRSLLRAGRLCLLEIREQLRSRTSDLKSYPIEFSIDAELTYIGLLNRLASHLGIKLFAEPAEPVEYSSLIQQAIVRSLQSGSIVLIEIHKWDALPSQREVLCWFLEQFWWPLLAQLPTIGTTYSNVRFITVLVVDGEIASDCLEYCCTHDELDGQKIIDLPLQDWTEDVIRDWLEYVGRPKQQSEAIAKRIHKASRGGIPEVICSALGREVAEF